MLAVRSSSLCLVRQKIQHQCITGGRNVARVLHSGRVCSQAAAAGKKNVAKQIVSKQQQEAVVREFDPHAMASDMIHKSEGRMQGTDAIASMTAEQKMRNYGTAAALLGFVTWVWWYSMQSVGKSSSSSSPDDIETKLREEAQDAVKDAESKTLSQQEAEELAQLDVTMSSELDADVVGEANDVIVAVAAPDEIATAEEDLNLAAAATHKTTSHTNGRPLWKKIVFFWRKE